MDANSFLDYQCIIYDPELSFTPVLMSRRLTSFSSHEQFLEVSAKEFAFLKPFLKKYELGAMFIDTNTKENFDIVDHLTLVDKKWNPESETLPVWLTLMAHYPDWLERCPWITGSNVLKMQNPMRWKYSRSVFKRHLKSKSTPHN